MPDEVAKRMGEIMRFADSGYIGRMFDYSYDPHPDRWDWYDTLDDAINSLQNRYEDGYDSFRPCYVTYHGDVVCDDPDESRFPAVSRDAEIALHRVVNGRVLDLEYPSYLIRLNDAGDAYVEEC